MQADFEPNGKISTRASGREAVAATSQVLQLHIRSQMVLRLGLYVLATVFVVVAALLVVFGPSGRETETKIVGLSLFVLAVGCAGFGTFAIKTPLISASAGANDPVRAGMPGNHESGPSQGETGSRGQSKAA